MQIPSTEVSYFQGGAVPFAGESLRITSLCKLASSSLELQYKSFKEFKCENSHTSGHVRQSSIKLVLLTSPGQNQQTREEVTGAEQSSILFKREQNSPAFYLNGSRTVQHFI